MRKLSGFQRLNTGGVPLHWSSLSCGTCVKRFTKICIGASGSHTNSNVIVTFIGPNAVEINTLYQLIVDVGQPRFTQTRRLTEQFVGPVLCECECLALWFREHGENILTSEICSAKEAEIRAENILGNDIILQLGKCVRATLIVKSRLYDCWANILHYLTEILVWVDWVRKQRLIHECSC